MAAERDTLAFWNPRRVLDLLGEPLSDQPAFSANACTVLARRYLRRDADGRLAETPRDLLRRVASAVAVAERGYGNDPAPHEARFLRMMERLEFLPNSPTLMNAGGELGNLAACFVLPVGDSLAEIFEAVKQTALIQQTGGGVGYSFSHLRPAGDVVATTHGVASGPVSFMEVFDTATETIKQGGRRRGALMGILSIDHPDILEFITAKSDPTRLCNFNVSVGMTDEFMRAVEDDADYALRSPRSGSQIKRLSARKVFDLICNLAWQSGEPGVLFVDRIEAHNPTPQVGRLESTNPCAELPLLAYESCVLGSLNLARFAAADGVDWERLQKRTHDAVRFLDDVIDASRYPLPAIEAVTRANRKVGLGVMGWADLLIGLGIAYDSEEALALGEQVMGFIAREARAASARLAQERGAFPNFSGSALEPAGPPLRNATTTTVAPTGTLSILAGCSGGIEPLFAVAFFRRILDGQLLEEVHPLFREAVAQAGVLDEHLLRRVTESGRVRGIPGAPDRLARLFATAHDVAPQWHVRMQAAFQRHVDNSVSKTVNLPRDARPAEVAQVYRLAYRLGCKGVTVYRDGSRRAQVLNRGEVERAAAEGRIAAERCPDCREPLDKPDGCVFCRSCGWSRCG